jgi:hypothetical protein
MRLTFNNAGAFAAVRAAEDWCAKHGLSVGAMERGKPRGILFGDYAIQKWHNLRQADKDALHGTMTGDMRNGPVTVAVDEHAVRRAGGLLPTEPRAALGEQA